MSKKNFLTIIILISLLLSFQTNAFAGSFRVLPIKVFLDENNKMETLRIRNESPDKVTIQVKAVEWGQDENGADTYQPANDIVYFPRIFTIEGNEERMLKVGYQKKMSEGEKTFRIFLEELPETKIGAETTLRMVLKMSIPVFINSEKGPEGKGKTDNGVIDKVELSGKTFSARIKNTGNTFFFIKTLRLSGKNLLGETVSFPEKHGWYLLKGAARTYTFEVPGDTCLKLKELNIEVETDNTTLKDTLSVKPEMCKG